MRRGRRGGRRCGMGLGDGIGFWGSINCRFVSFWGSGRGGRRVEEGGFFSLALGWVGVLSIRFLYDGAVDRLSRSISMFRLAVIGLNTIAGIGLYFCGWVVDAWY